MARRIYKKLGGERIGSGGKMTVEAHGYGYSTHDVGKVRRTSMSFGTIVPMGMWMLTTGSRLKMKLDALITSNALSYQLYGSAKFQIDVFTQRVAGYNAKMQLNLLDQGYNIDDVKFPQMELETRGLLYQYGDSDGTKLHTQINKSALLAYLGIRYNGQSETGVTAKVKRKYNAMLLMMYYQTVKEYYANKQEKIGMMIHNEGVNKTIERFNLMESNGSDSVDVEFYPSPLAPANRVLTALTMLNILGTGPNPQINEVQIITMDGIYGLTELYDNVTLTVLEGVYSITSGAIKPTAIGKEVDYYGYALGDKSAPKLVEWDLKAVDRMSMKVLADVESDDALIINRNTELPYGASFKIDETGEFLSIETSQEGLCIGCYQSDVFNNYLDNATINALANKNKVKVAEDGTWSINDLNITQKLYNYDQRIGVTDGTLEEWREMTYGQITKTKSLKPVYVGGLSKEIVFDMVVSTASTEEDPLGSIASRGQFGSKHKGGFVEIETDEEKLVMVLAKITPRLVYNQGNEWWNNLKSLEDLHKPALDKIGYQDLVTDTMGAFETVVKEDGTIQTYSAGKQPAWQWYRTNYDDALGNMADVEDYKVFGREYDWTVENDRLRIKDLTTYIDPQKFNDVFAIKSLDAMNFDVQVGMDATLTMIMSEEVIPNL